MNARTLFAAALGSFGFALPLTAALPVAVSPGSSSGIAHVANRCPTFSWSAVEDASGYDLLVLGVDEVETRAGEVPHSLETGAAPALEVTIRGAAFAWTPTAERCLDPGKRYAWSVRALVGGAPGPWAEAQLFEIGAPAASDCELVVERVLDRLLVARGLVAVTADATEPAAAPDAATSAPTSGIPDRPIEGGASAALSGTAALGLYASLPDTTTGETWGVHGVTHSNVTGSAGVVGEATDPLGNTRGVVGSVASIFGTAGLFENTGGGKILVGYGSSGEVLSVAGSGAVTAPLFSGDLQCSGCVSASELGANSVTSSHIGNGEILFSDLNGNGCASGQVMKWGGSSWACAADDGGTGGDSDWTVSGSNQYSAVSGNVGIGTSSPTGKLHVALGSGQYVQFGSGGIVSEMRLTNGRINSSNNALRVQGNDLFGSARAIRLETGATPRLTVSTAGNVGIGTTSPTEKLQVTGTIHSTSGGFRFPDGSLQASAVSSGHAHAHNHAGEEWTSSEDETLRLTNTSTQNFTQALYAQASNTTVQNYGVWAQASGSSGRGLYAIATHDTGITYGIKVRNESPAGYAGFFGNPAGGHLIAASSTDSKSDLDFLVDNDGDVMAKSFSGEMFWIGVEYLEASFSCPAGEDCTEEVVCPSGKAIVGGSVDLWDLDLLESHPKTGDRWEGTIVNRFSVARSFTIHAICAKVS